MVNPPSDAIIYRTDVRVPVCLLSVSPPVTAVPLYLCLCPFLLPPQQFRCAVVCFPPATARVCRAPHSPSCSACATHHLARPVQIKTVREYQLLGTSTSKIVPYASQTLSGVSFSEAGGVTTMTFTRSMNADAAGKRVRS